jgi:GAF domain-containing protein
VSPTPESELADPQQIIADLRSANAKLQLQFDRAAAERDEEEAQKAAMAEVLGVISASPGRLEPVFEAMLANAVRICGGSFGMLTLYEDGGFRGVAAHGDAASFPEHMSRIHRGVLPGTTLDGLAVTLRTVQLADVAAEPAYDPVRALNPAYARVRSHLCVPLIKENQLLGAILIYRDRVKQFDRKEVELVENFAAQAVIAMENARRDARSLGAADRDRRGVASHQFFARRPISRVSGDRRQGGEVVRCR